MYLKWMTIAGALLISAAAFAQQAPQQDTANFILGHGFLQPVQPSSDCPPGHAMTERAASSHGGSEHPREYPE
jgi:hypothetical protein